jgi:hypothetical protein
LSIAELPFDEFLPLTNFVEQRTQRAYGQQVEDRQSEREAEVFQPSRAAVSALRTAARRLSEIWVVPHLFPQVGGQRFDSRRSQGELVGGDYWQTAIVGKKRRFVIRGYARP